MVVDVKHFINFDSLLEIAAHIMYYKYTQFSKPYTLSRRQELGLFGFLSYQEGRTVAH